MEEIFFILFHYHLWFIITCAKNDNNEKGQPGLPYDFGVTRGVCFGPVMEIGGKMYFLVSKPLLKRIRCIIEESEISPLDV